MKYLSTYNLWDYFTDGFNSFFAASSKLFKLCENIFKQSYSLFQTGTTSEHNYSSESNCPFGIEPLCKNVKLVSIDNIYFFAATFDIKNKCILLVQY